MATTGILNGTALKVYVDGTAIGAATSHSLSVSHEVRDTSSKDSGGWSESLEGMRSWTIDFEGFVAFDGTENFEELFGMIGPTRTNGSVKFTTEVSGDARWIGTGWLSDLSADSGLEESVTYSGSFTGTGPLTLQSIT